MKLLQKDWKRGPQYRKEVWCNPVHIWFQLTIHNPAQKGGRDGEDQRKERGEERGRVKCYLFSHLYVESNPIHILVTNTKTMYPYPPIGLDTRQSYPLTLRLEYGQVKDTSYIHVHPNPTANTFPYWNATHSFTKVRTLEQHKNSYIGDQNHLTMVHDIQMIETGPPRRPQDAFEQARNVDEGVVIVHTVLCNKTRLKIQTLRSTLRAPKQLTQQPLRRVTKTALGPRFAVGVSSVKVHNTKV